ncbi:hypothetical protein [Metaplanococcus flavidus]|uniref:Uncharacterized protein n=1 Tax=Metaplanococcus flavidus TaxID=569883 RepID=A0ABW3LA17_9BACL
MDQNQNERKEFLQQQLQWTKGQIDILDQMDMKLQEMKGIAEHVAHNELSQSEIVNSSAEINALNQEYEKLIESYQMVVH